MDKILQYVQTHNLALKDFGTQLGKVEAHLRSMEESSRIVCAKLETEAPVEDHDVVRPRSELEDHRTAPHRLMRYWPSIGSLLKGAGFDYSDDYVRDVEDRGTLSLYTAGELDDHAAISSRRSLTSTSATDTYESSATFGEPQQVWSTGRGDLKPDGSLQLDTETIDTLHESYLKQIHIMHPFIDVCSLREMVVDFIAVHSTSKDIPGSVSFNAETRRGQTDSLKRKRNERSTNSPMPTAGSERRAQHAVVYLVLALGKVCLHQYIMSDVWYNTPTGNGMDSNSMVATLKDATFSSAASTISFASAKIHHLPDLAYYGKAAEVLGEKGDGNELIHAQMFLLAGLYNGQLARVNESMSWITRASGVAMVLLERHKMYADY
ncbi:hypothetical protein LTR86_011307 [Recurvomyces mirabilis]|nr:hypothetical protein LTR86_011307 [Recurvomyces mirabilis]